jgi:hypothetical protein
MKFFPFLLSALLLPIVAQAAVTIDEFGTGRIYSLVNGDGVSVFTDIEPEELQVGQGVGSSSGAPIVLPRGKVVNVNLAATRHAVAANTSPLPYDPAIEAIPPELRDGGPPPEDH